MNVNIGNVLSGVGALIAAYLVFTNYQAFNAIIGTGGAFSLSAVQTLQGRATPVAFKPPNAFGF